MSANAFAHRLIAALESADVRLVAGVPDGLLTDAITSLQAHETITYVPCAREEECFGVAAGTSLAGERAVVLVQNAGFLNSIGAYATLLQRYRLPIPVIVAHRGGLYDAKPYDIEKFDAFEALSPDYFRRFNVTLGGMTEADVTALIGWCESAARPAILALEKGAPHG